VGDWVKSNPLRALFVLVRQAPKGRRAKTAAGRRSRSKKSQQAARAAREPWLLVASTSFADVAPKRVVRDYRQRMQIEERFRDLKSQQFGAGLECRRSDGVGRFTVLMLIAALAAFLLWLLGTAAEHAGVNRRLHPGNGKAPRLLAAVPGPLADGAARRLGRPRRSDEINQVARSMGRG
jgi:hypothetical protein